ncbi:tetraspanin-33 isoform X2 [Nelusetta ayraudi]|uniref:tetraspanin-33 isoform X2 n=1 Tax=Nelusetta ayraudi TaxID=303726 RepID=UPI003F6EBA9E
MKRYRAVKYTLFTCCYVFWVVSGLVTAVGFYSRVAKERGMLAPCWLDPALLLLLLGSLTFVLTFLGCCGSLRNAPCLLKTFAGFLSAVILLQVVAGAAAFLLTDTVMERTEAVMKRALLLYREDRDLENLVDFLQRKCCGVDSYLDWSHNQYFHCSQSNPSLEACAVPFSCCRGLHLQSVLNTMCGYGVQRLDESSANQLVSTSGCLEELLSWSSNNLLLLGGLLGALLLLEVTLVSLAAVQLFRIKQLQRLQREAAPRRSIHWFPAVTQVNDPAEPTRIQQNPAELIRTDHSVALLRFR